MTYEPSSTASTSVSEERHPCNRVMVVDDDPDIRESLMSALEIEGKTAIGVSGGVEALTQLANGELPDAVVLDLRMPDLAGQDVLELLHFAVEHKSLDRMAVIIITADWLASEQDLYEAGADKVLRKPFDIKDLFIALGDDPKDWDFSH